MLGSLTPLQRLAIISIAFLMTTVDWLASEMLARVGHLSKQGRPKLYTSLEMTVLQYLLDTKGWSEIGI